MWEEKFRQDGPRGRISGLGHYGETSGMLEWKSRAVCYLHDTEGRGQT